MASKPLLRLLLCLGLGASATLPFAAQDSAKDVLRQVLRSQRSVDYLHIETRSFGGGSATAKVKVQTLSGKGVTVTILEPSYRANIVSVDNTKELKTYFPDENQLVIQPSPVLLQPNFDLRWRLISENYRVRPGAWGRIADQRVREYHLVPEHEEVPIRRMFIDPKNSVMLKYVVGAEDDRQTIVFDTKYVVFGREAAEAGFGLPAKASSARRVTAKGPIKLEDPLDSKSEAGFSARLPDELPFGFAVSGAYLFGSGKDPYVGVKLTDGMATLTVYQWRRGWARSPADAGMVTYDKYGVGYGIAVVPGDWMPEEVLEQIVEAFSRRGE